MGEHGRSRIFFLHVCLPVHMFYVCHTVIICKFLMFEYRYPVIPLVKYCLDWLSCLFIHLRWLPRKNIWKNNWRNCFHYLAPHWTFIEEFSLNTNNLKMHGHICATVSFFRFSLEENSIWILPSIYCRYILFTLCTLYFIYDSELRDHIIIALNLFQI